MDDREIVAAIAAGDPGGLADAYDAYAESLYGYCHWMLGEPEDAAGAIQDTFVIAAAGLDGLRDPRKLRPWLYAVARNECQGRQRAGPDAAGADEAGLDQDGLDEMGDQSPGAGGRSERAGLRRLIRAALDGLDPGEREVIELGLRHELHGADLAAVLGVPRSQAHALASRARARLEKALGVLIMARTGRACPDLDQLLDDWDGRLTGPIRKRVSRHIDQCEECAERRHGALRPTALSGMAPLAAVPRGLRGEVLSLCADTSPQGQAYRQEVLQDAGPFRPGGFPEAIRPPRQRVLALSGVAAAAGVLIAVAATGIITALALGGSHAPRAADAAGSGRLPGTAGAQAPSNTGPAVGGTSPSLSPTAGATAVTGAPPAVASPSASPATAKPSPSAASSSPAAPLPKPSPPTSRPTPTFTFTFTPTPTVTATLPP
jgi:RNA polymerase sigma factor (sigma-70 family)